MRRVGEDSKSASVNLKDTSVFRSGVIEDQGDIRDGDRRGQIPDAVPRPATDHVRLDEVAAARGSERDARDVLFNIT